MARTPPPPAARRRAVRPEDKHARRGEILAAAEALLAGAPMGAFSVDALARRAGVAKGTVYLYFRTREEVLLAVHGARAQALFDAVEQALAARRLEPRVMVRGVQRFLDANPGFLPLAATCRSLLENNVGVEAALEFKQAINRRLETIGAQVEARYPTLRRGTGIELLTNCYALMLGLWQLADPPPCLDAALQAPEFARFRIDLDRQLGTALMRLWEGTVGTPEEARR